MRTILHVDMNAYFASVEQAANPFLRGKPIAVGGGVGGKRTVVAACSYEAKARGVKNAMPAWEAKKICPDLIMVAGDMSKYIHTSSEIIKFLKTFTPQVEVFSIDEAFMDVTDTKDRFRLRSSSCGGQVGGEIAIAKEIKRRIRERFHLTCSIGIGPNKLLAKLAGELKKPDGLMRLEIGNLDSIRDIPVEKLCGVGRKLEEYLGQMGIKTFGNLNRFPREKLVKRFGAVWGEQLYAMGQGKDNSPVLPSNAEEEAKSMGHSYTLPHNTTDVDEVKGYLLRLSEQVGRRLRKDSYKGKVIHAALGFKDLSFWGKQKKIEDYIDDGYEIYKIAENLMPSPLPADPIRFVGVTVSSLIHHLDQISLLPQKEANKKALKAVDEINNRYGEFTVERAAIMKTVIHEKTGMVAPRRYQVSC